MTEVRLEQKQTEQKRCEKAIELAKVKHLFIGATLIMKVQY
jgi:hypothetical protein